MVYLIEDIDAVKRYYPNIPDEMFMILISLDPTYRNNNSLGKYGKWILNLYNRGNLSEDEFDEVTPLLNQFTTYRNRIQNKDLNAYKSLDALAEVLASVVDDDSMLTDRQKLRFLKNVKAGRTQTAKENDYDTVYEDSDWVVWIPNTHEASMKLGKGTSWCTAHENPEWYDLYTTEDGDEEFFLYIMKNKQTGKRFQYCDNPYRGIDMQFMDEDDSDVDVEYFMRDEVGDDEEFIEYLVELNPDFFRNIRFVGDGDLKAEGNVIIGTADYIEPTVRIPDGIEEIGDEAFHQNKDIDKIILSDTVTVIGNRSFYESSVSEVNFEDAYNLECIGDSAFAFCKLIYATFPDSLIIVYPHSFESSDLKWVEFGSGIRHIAQGAFADCIDLREVTIEQTRDYLKIRERAFANCPSFNMLRLPENIKSIDKTAFEGCYNLSIYSDSQYMVDNIENGFEDCSISLYTSDGDLIYDPDRGFVEEDE